MAWSVIVEEDGRITLPPDLIASLGWTPDTPLCWSDDEDGVKLGPVEPTVDKTPL